MSGFFSQNVLNAVNAALAFSDQIDDFGMGAAEQVLYQLKIQGYDVVKSGYNPDKSLCRICGVKPVSPPFDHCGSDDCIPF